MTDLTLPQHRPTGVEAHWRDYLDLLKPRVMSLVVFTGVAGLIAAPGSLHPVLAAVAVLCIAVAAGAAGAINMWFDRDIDAVMRRTRQRPIVRGVVRPGDALAFGIFLSFASVALMGLAVNWVAAGILAFANLFYVLIYTMWLKRSTPQNIVIGGAAGAFPPMIGWAAVTGDVSLTSVALFAVIFFWTPPHFWALALWRSDDYREAGVPMLPVVSGVPETKRQIVLYSLLLLPLSMVPAFTGGLGWVYGTVAALCGGVFLLKAVQVWREDGESADWRAAKRLFGFSIVYLFALFAAVIADAMMRGLFQ